MSAHPVLIASAILSALAVLALVIAGEAMK